MVHPWHPFVKGGHPNGARSPAEAHPKPKELGVFAYLKKAIDDFDQNISEKVFRERRWTPSNFINIFYSVTSIASFKKCVVTLLVIDVLSYFHIGSDKKK